MVFLVSSDVKVLKDGSRDSTETKMHYCISSVEGGWCSSEIRPMYVSAVLESLETT